MLSRRQVLELLGPAALGALGLGPVGLDRRAGADAGPPSSGRQISSTREGRVTLFLCGDVMTGRGIDQILPHPSRPHLYESYVDSALGYVELAERVSGAIPRPREFTYVWGEALEVWGQRTPDLRIVNLETSVTLSEDWAAKGINYRMHPKNAACLTAAGIDCCVLANNHVLDWGVTGLEETLKTLREADVRTAGAGNDRDRARAPAELELDGGGRVLVFAYGSPTSGVPRDWAATGDRPGVAFLPDLSAASLREIAAEVDRVKRPGDLVVVSLHWGGNWGYEVRADERRFAQGLVDDAGADVVHGHSSHHPRGIELHAGKPILYGCGDFLNDYEGIRGQERYRAELVLMYFATFEGGSNEPATLEIVPMRIRRFRLQRANSQEAEWLAATLDRESRKLGTRIELDDDGSLVASG